MLGTWLWMGPVLFFGTVPNNCALLSGGDFSHQSYGNLKVTLSFLEIHLANHILLQNNKSNQSGYVLTVIRHINCCGLSIRTGKVELIQNTKPSLYKITGP